jgi:hypothetical protein
VATGTGTLPVSDIHADSVEGMVGSGEEFSMVVSSYGCHIANRKRRVAFMVHLDAGTSTFEYSPVMEGTTPGESLQIVA